jgi:hypothetical protein
MSMAARTVIYDIRRLLSRDRAAIYSMIGRLWLVLTGPVTIVVLAIHFSSYDQGYFFTFMSLAAIRTAAELGLGQVIIVRIAQLYATAAGSTDASAPQVGGFVRFTAKWFASVGFILAGLLCVAGTLLLGASKGLPTAAWLPQWITLSWLVGLDVALSGLLFPLEGAGQVRPVYFCRMVRSFVNSLALWLFILLGFQLWSISIGLACSLVWTSWFLFSKGRLVIDALRPDARVARIEWRSQVLPAQWRLALSGLAEYVSFYTVIPLMYVMHGPVIAGQLGVTWQLAAAVSSIAGAIVFTRFPEFSRLVGARSIQELDGLLVSTSMISMAICILGAVGFGSAVLVLQTAGLEIAARMLPFGQVVILLVGLLIWHSNLTIVSYLRAHGGDPYLPASLIGGVLLFAANLTLGRWFGPVGLLWGYILTGACFMVPCGLYLLQRERRAWGYAPFKIAESFGRAVRRPTSDRDAAAATAARVPVS